MRIVTAEAQDDADQYWIGVDLDSTLAEHTDWKGDTHIGAPIPKMVQRVKDWLRLGKRVKIMTARAAEMTAEAKAAIEAWCMEHIGQVLEITNEKDRFMEELWDDKAVRVEENTGEIAVLAKALNRIVADTKNPANTDAINETQRDIGNKSAQIKKLRSQKKQYNQRTTNKRAPESVKRSQDFTKRIADTTIDRANSEEKLKHLRGDKKRPTRFK